MDATTRLSTEKIQRQALLVLYNHLNDTIASMNQTWSLEDDEFWAALNRGNEGWFVEQIEDNNFYAGTVPSLINAPPEKYPNLCTICYIARPPNSTDDDGELYNDVLAIEVMVRGTDEQEVNSRIQKTLDAVNLTFMDSLENRTLNNTIPLLNAPTQTIGDVFIGRKGTRMANQANRQRYDGNDQDWFWQGGSLEYTVQKYVSFS